MKRYITEFIGTFFLVMGAILGGAIGASLALMVMIYAGGHISGAHYNPAVSFAMWMRGKLEGKDIFIYWAFQLLGAALAAFIVCWLLNEKGTAACAIAADNSASGIIAELIGTFALTYVVLNVATTAKTAGNSYFGLAIGGTVLAMATVLGKFSGGVYNPAVFVGLAIQKTLCLEQWWIYMVGSFGGATLAAIFFSYCNPDDK